MPDPYDRHGRSRDMDWGSQLPRSQQRAAAAQEPAKRPPGKKDPDLCKGKHWKGPHVTEVQSGKHAWFGGKYRECHWDTHYWRNREPYWSCIHVLICSGCGKDFGYAGRGLCPDFHEITPEEQAVLDKQLQEYDERVASRKWLRNKKPITGPQGYRKKKNET